MGNKAPSVTDDSREPPEHKQHGRFRLGGMQSKIKPKSCDQNATCSGSPSPFSQTNIISDEFIRLSCESTSSLDPEMCCPSSPSSTDTDVNVSETPKEVEELRAELESTKCRAEAAERKAKELSQYQTDSSASGARNSYEYCSSHKRILSSNLEVKPKLQHYQGLLKSESMSSESQEHLSISPEWVVNRVEIMFTGRELGRGGWAVVREATFRGSKVAAKCLHKEIISDYNQGVFVREISIAAKLRHPNLVQFIGATVEGEPVILTELMETSLRSLIRESVPLTQLQSIDIGMQVAKGLNYLHLRMPDPIIHRDVSSANILLNSGKNETWLAKLGDFGAANFQRLSNTAAPGNATYSAPESSSPSAQSVKLDAYSFGIVMLEVYARKFPRIEEQETLLNKIDNSQVKCIISKCLEVQQVKRPTMGELINDLSTLIESVVDEDQVPVETSALLIPSSSRPPLPPKPKPFRTHSPAPEPIYVKLPSPNCHLTNSTSQISDGVNTPCESRRSTSSTHTAKKRTFERDIVCLPFESSNQQGVFPFPLSQSLLQNLRRQGLIEKICLHSDMSESEIFAEMRSVFKGPFGDNDKFPFKILQSSGLDGHHLIPPVLSTTYVWNANKVAGSSGNSVYIWAQMKLHIDEDEEHDSEPENYGNSTEGSEYDSFKIPSNCGSTGSGELTAGSHSFDFSDMESSPKAEGIEEDRKVSDSQSSGWNRGGPPSGFEGHYNEEQPMAEPSGEQKSFVDENTLQDWNRQEPPLGFHADMTEIDLMTDEDEEMTEWNKAGPPAGFNMEQDSERDVPKVQAKPRHLRRVNSSRIEEETPSGFQDSEEKWNTSKPPSGFDQYISEKNSNPNTEEPPPENLTCAYEKSSSLRTVPGFPLEASEKSLRPNTEESPSLLRGLESKKDSNSDAENSATGYTSEKGIQTEDRGMVLEEQFDAGSGVALVVCKTEDDLINHSKTLQNTRKFVTSYHKTRLYSYPPTSSPKARATRELSEPYDTSLVASEESTRFSPRAKSHTLSHLPGKPEQVSLSKCWTADDNQKLGENSR